MDFLGWRRNRPIHAGGIAITESQQSHCQHSTFVACNSIWDIFFTDWDQCYLGNEFMAAIPGRYLIISDIFILI